MQKKSAIFLAVLAFCKKRTLMTRKIGSKIKKSKLAYISSKSGKCMKQMSIPPSLEVPFFGNRE